MDVPSISHSLAESKITSLPHRCVLEGQNLQASLTFLRLKEAVQRAESYGESKWLADRCPGCFMPDVTI